MKHVNYDVILVFWVLNFVIIFFIVNWIRAFEKINVIMLFCLILVTIVARNLKKEKKKKTPFSRACLSQNDKAGIPCL